MASTAAIKLIKQLNEGIDKQMERLKEIMGTPAPALKRSELAMLGLINKLAAGWDVEAISARERALLERSTPYHGQVRK